MPKQLKIKKKYKAENKTSKEIKTEIIKNELNYAHCRRINYLQIEKVRISLVLLGS